MNIVVVKIVSVVIGLGCFALLVLHLLQDLTFIGLLTGLLICSGLYWWAEGQEDGG